MTHPTARIQCKYLPEPLLMFGSDGLHVDPKSGIARYGPRSIFSAGRHPRRVRVGLIGTAETIVQARHWLESNAQGVPGDEKHTEFPGFHVDRGFLSTLEFDDSCDEQITQAEIKNVLGIRSQRDRFEQAVGLVDQKLRLLTDRDYPPHYVVISLPDQLIRRCRVADYNDKILGNVHRDLRRAIKAAAMKYRIPTQLMRQQTIEGKDKDHPSKIAWNLFTGLYFKSGGVPWGPYGLEAGSCYLGVSFYRPPGSKSSTMHTSLVQAFDEHGEGLVLRGPTFDWDPAKAQSRSPHLSEELAEGLVQAALSRYRQELKQNPQRVVIHKTSRYWPEERAGFESVLEKQVSRYDLVAFQAQSVVRLFTTSKYPPLRGTYFSVGDLDYLYTTGFISALNEFHAMHVPSPIQIADHVGQDTPRETLLKEMLLLTKMNWNSARFGGLLPVTVRFSRLVGDIMREIPANGDPLPQFKFYI